MSNPVVNLQCRFTYFFIQVLFSSYLWGPSPRRDSNFNPTSHNIDNQQAELLRTCLPLGFQSENLYRARAGISSPNHNCRTWIEKRYVEQYLRFYCDMFYLKNPKSTANQIMKQKTKFKNARLILNDTHHKKIQQRLTSIGGRDTVALPLTIIQYSSIAQ